MSRNVRILVCILILDFLNISSATRIKFYGGEYSNILVSISPEIEEADCRSLLLEIQSALWGTSVKLQRATDDRVRFANIKILLPRAWNPTVCGLSQSEISQATAADSYSSADIKITGNHPLAKSLPWTSQFKGCGESGEDIFIPPDFLGASSLLTADQKSQLLLHEWMKLRYGVFEEYGYFGDEAYPACYVREANLHFTACSSTVLQPLTNDIGANCQSEVNAKGTELKTLLESGSGSSSLMSMPHLNNTVQFCVQSNHNGFAATKQNALCGRRSVSDVINSHPDFISTYAMNSTNSSSSPKQMQTQFEFIRHDFNEYSPGYAFLIEDTAFIRQESRLTHIKQAIAQMIDITADNSSTMVAISRFAGGTATTPQFYSISNDANKESFINLLPDVNSPPLSSKLSMFSAKQSTGSNNLYFVFQQVIEQLNTRSHKWNIFLITSSPSYNLQEARDLVHGTPYSLSVLTFDNSNGWLQMYTTPNTRNVMVLPNCIRDGNVCSTKASSLAVDEFVELLRSQDSPRFLEKVVQAEVERGVQSWFTVESTASRVTKFFLHFSVFTSSVNQIQFTSPSGNGCTASRVYNYEYLYSTNQACGYEFGNWTVDLSSLPENVKYTIQAYAESDNEPNRFVVRTSLGTTTTTELMPNSQLTAVYARVMDLNDRPVVDAQIELTIHTSISTLDSFQEILRDDGIDPDIIKNDGVYSTYLQNYSPSVAYHIGQLTVTSVTSQTRSVLSLRSTNDYSAALLDPNLSSKCCGSSVPVADTLPIANACFSALLPGFLTGEGFDSSTLPPAKIGNIKIAEDDEGTSTLILEFVAPGAIINTGRVDHYDTCCSVNDSGDSSCTSISPAGCIPVDAGLIQRCSLSRDILATSYLETMSKPDENQTFYLHCGVRGVNAMLIPGALSNNLVEIEIFLNAAGGDENTGGVIKSLKCETIGDDCLPIWVFWTMIGCIIGLVVVLLAIILCWCLTSRKNKTSNGKNKEEVLMKMNREPKMPDKDSPLYNVYVNKAYIQETDGGMKLVAAEGELLPFDTNDNGISMSNNQNHHQHISAPVPSVRRRSVSAEMDRERNPGIDDTRLYKSYLTNKPEPPPKPSNNNNKNSTFLGSRSEENLAPIARNRYPKGDSGYANSHNNNNDPTLSSRVPISTISSRMDDDMLPIYASVNRNGRRGYPNQPIGSMNHNNSTFQRPNKSQNDDFSSSRPHSSVYPNGGGGSGDMPIPNRFSRPISSSSHNHPQSLPATRPSSSARLDAFPSSESESYSDMSRGIPVLPTPPPVPPPFPNGTINHNNKSLIRNAPDRLNIQPITNTNKTPTRTPVRESGLSSPLGPPPPPPKRQSIGHIPNNNNSKLPNSGSEYDDDSDNWDDEDFEFAPAGHSFA